SKYTSDVEICPHPGHWPHSPLTGMRKTALVASPFGDGAIARFHVQNGTIVQGGNMRFHGLRPALLAGLSSVAVYATSQPADAAKLKTIYSFCSLENCADGVNPMSGLVADGAGNLYGVTSGGGSNGNGTIFELLKGKRRYTFRLIYTLAAC